MERVYRTMKVAGAANIAIGILMIVVGVTTGILSIVTGANLLKRKSELNF